MAATKKLVQNLMAKACTFKKPYNGITKKQLATLLSITPNAVDHWVNSRNGINIENLTFLMKLSTVIDSKKNGSFINVRGKKGSTSRCKVDVHGLSKYDNKRYVFKTKTGNKWISLDNVLINN